MRNLEECLVEMVNLLREVRALIQDSDFDTKGWEIILGLIAAEVEATYWRMSENTRWGKPSAPPED